MTSNNSGGGAWLLLDKNRNIDALTIELNLKAIN